MTPADPERIRQDGRLIGQTLFRLTLPQRTRRAIVLAAVALLWLYACSRILAFGATVRYDALATLGQQPVEFLARINPYLWWAVVLVFSLIVFFAARGWLQASLRRGRDAAVPARALGELAPALSPDVIEVVRWIWRDRLEPLTLGDLQAVHREVRSGRVAKMYLARDQEAALARPAAAPRAPAPSPDSRHAEPHLGRLDDD